jgi:hypothetical protein
MIIKNLIICVVLFICIILIYKYSHLYLKNNDERHLYDNNSYAHYSKITKSNIIFYPKYIFCHPIKYTLNKGDALIIPKHWWHWVFSFKNTFGVNYWFSDNDISNNKLKLFNKPKSMRHFIKPCNLSDYKDKIINEFEILNGINDKLINTNLIELVNNNSDNIYLLTLNAFTDNNNIRESLKNIILHPKFIIDNNINKNYNFWYSPKKMDTGLHYDDTYGILCVLNGTKIVYLYPPSDSEYLYPYELKPSWYYNKFEPILYNIYKKYESNDYHKIPSNNILYESFYEKKKHMIRIVDHLKKLNKTIIYGIKNDMTNIWYEYYFYNIDKIRNTNELYINFDINKVIKYLSKNQFMTLFNEINHDIIRNFKNKNNITIFSFEVHDNNIKNEIDLHVNINNIIDLPFYGKTYTLTNNLISEKNIFVVDTLNNFIDNIDTYMKYFNLEHIKTLVIKELNTYSYVEIISFYKKSENDIAIQWFGITQDDMNNFLELYKWPENIIKYYKNNNLDHISHEITINYKINNNNLIVSRTSLYGSI